MNADILQQIAEEFLSTSSENIISPKIAIQKELAGLSIFSSPLLGFAAAAEKYFIDLQNETIVGFIMSPPDFWLPSARTVISIFLPFSNQVKESNRKKGDRPSFEWMHGRIDGQKFTNALCSHLQTALYDEGYEAMTPGMDKRLWSVAFPNENTNPVHSYKTNWSERHAAYICGLGTFSLSKGLITSKGVAGRLGSIITSLELPPTVRPYKHIDEYCIMCGACIKNCPVNAISFDKGKANQPCSKLLKQVLDENPPYYGCGKCQCAVPCESEIPKKTI